MKTRKSTGNGAFWVVVILTNSLNTKTSMINYSIVMRSVNANLLEINRRQKRLDLFDADLKSASSEYIFP